MLIVDKHTSDVCCDKFPIYADLVQQWPYQNDWHN